VPRRGTVRCIDSAAQPSFFGRHPLLLVLALAWGIATYWAFCGVASRELSLARRVFVVLGLAAILAPLSFSARDFYDDGVRLFEVALSLLAAPAGPFVLAGVSKVMGAPLIYPSDVPYGVFSLQLALTYVGLVGLGYAQWFIVTPKILRRTGR
jgi:hypothetical protein